MKKLALIIAFMMFIPGAAFGLEMLNDSAMENVTGQHGVSIALDDVQLFINIGKIAWIDCDGFADYYGGTSGLGGAVGISNFQIDTLLINAIASSDGMPFGSGDGTAGTVNPNFGSGSCGFIPLQFDYGSTAPLSGCSLVGSTHTNTKGLDNFIAPITIYGGIEDRYYRAISIDATSELPALTAINNSNAGNTTQYTGGVIIGLPLFEIYIPTLSMTPEFYDISGGRDSINDASTGANYGKIVLNGVTFTPLSGWIEIAPH